MDRLSEIIRADMEQSGAISFARFMELSLYCPQLGYYERLSNTPGRGGDFYTSVSVGSLFGDLLAFQFAHWMEAAKLDSFQLVEAGAHDGRLARDILTWFQSRRPHLCANLEYWILEPSLQRRQWQEGLLASFAPHVRWFDSWECAPQPGVQGVIFSNELLDAFPVHRLGWDARAKKWFEWAVGWEAGRFAWKQRAWNSTDPNRQPADSSLISSSEQLQAVLPDGFTTEVAPAAAAWWRQAASSLKRGWLLTLDYGLPADDFFLPQRANGTLRAFHRHQLSADLLANAGEQDLTAHVNFTALQSAGESVGLRIEALQSQTSFLTRLAQRAWKPEAAFGEWTPERTRQFQTLTHPDHLGRPIKVLIQSR